MLFRVAFDVLAAPRVTKGRHIRKVDVTGTDPTDETVRRQIKNSIASSCECGLEDIRLRSVAGETKTWHEDTHGVDNIGISIDLATGATSAPEAPKRPARIPTKEELFDPKRTKDELMAVVPAFEIPADRLPANLAGKVKAEIAEALDNYFRPKAAPNTGGAGAPGEPGTGAKP